jgi:phosphonate transport system permease protein
VSAATLARTGEQPRPTKPPVRWTVWAGGVVFLAITLWAALEPLGGIGFSLAALFSEQFRAGGEIVAQFFDPDWSILSRSSGAFFETVYVAVIAAVFGCGAALPVALLASRVSNSNRVSYGIARTVLSVVRSLPDIAWALILVTAVGTGALGGLLALTIFNVGVVAKLTSETIDAVDLGPLEAARASGAGRIQTAWISVVPQILPGYLSYTLYVFELNLRASIVLGYVGAGGIGDVIRVQLARFEYESVGAIIIAVFVIVVLLDQASIGLRRRLV